MKTVYTVVSFEKVPFADMGHKANEILALGWQCEHRLPDRWTVKFSKEVPDDVASATADDEIKAVMGDLWFDPAEEAQPAPSAPITTQTVREPRFTRDTP